MKVGIQLNKDAIEEKKSSLDEIEQKLIKAFYGIGEVKKTELDKLSKISKMSMFDTQKTLVRAINKLRETKN